MDEKDRVITEIYNEAKERARWVQALLQIPFFFSSLMLFGFLMALRVRFFRTNGFKKQMEILRQKHTEFKEKYKRSNAGEDK